MAAPRHDTSLAGQIANAQKDYDDYSKEKDIKSQKQSLINCWTQIEYCLKALLQSKGVKVDSQAQADGSHSFHENLIKAFEDPKLGLPSLAAGPIQGIMWDCKTVRNQWSKPGQYTNAEVELELHKLVNGLPLVLKALGEARVKARIP